MPQNRFDQASRFAVKIDPPGFLAWATGLPNDGFTFVDWLDTRSVVFPGDADRTGDTVARLEDPSGTEPPWAVAVEFQIEPDATMFGRLMVYLGNLWLIVKSDEEPGGRFNVGAVVVNLTGTGLATRRMDWPGAGMSTQLVVVERNMAHENADELLGAIESGTQSRCLLPWIPLMTGGGDEGIIERWKRAAEAEPSYHKRNRLLLPTRIFADVTDRAELWEKALEGWNVKESPFAEGLVAEGETKAYASIILTELRQKFAPLPDDVVSAIRSQRSPDRLQQWVSTAFRCSDLADFRQRIGLNSNPDSGT